MSMGAVSNIQIIKTIDRNSWRCNQESVSILIADALVHQAISIHINDLTLKHRETYGCVVSTAATDALVLKHQVISTLNAD